MRREQQKQGLQDRLVQGNRTRKRRCGKMKNIQFCNRNGRGKANNRAFSNQS